MKKGNMFADYEEMTCQYREEMFEEKNDELILDQQELEDRIYWAYVQTLDWSLCDYDPEDFICDYFDEEEFELYREQCLLLAATD